MKNEIPEEDYRQLSELQHYIFCRRQWALIHVEQQWNENLLTTQGELMHERVHNDDLTELRGDKLVVRGMRVKSDTLAVTGICDVVEFTQSEDGITLHGREGKWLPRPVEYKHGKEKKDNSDALQLCGQAMCLEEMLCCTILSGDLFYGEPHRRVTVDFTQELRSEVTSALGEMNELFQKGYTPKVRKSKSCAACSLKDVCLPEMEILSAAKYIKQMIDE